jgi:Lar family restriction alleviation protein
MNVETYVGSKHVISLHYEPGVDPPLLPCPFCGGTDMEVENTHTPSYAVECEDCGAAIGTPPGLTDGAKTRANHRRAFLAAISAWNTRPKEGAK